MCIKMMILTPGDRRTLNALHVNLNPIDVCGGQSAWDDKSHRCTLRAECAGL